MKLNILEKALQKYPNRFELTMMAVSRAKEINSGDAKLLNEEEDAKPVIVALEELAEGAIIPSTIEEMLAIREAKRRVREKALLASVDAEKDEVDDQTLSIASPESSTGT